MGSDYLRVNMMMVDRLCHVGFVLFFSMFMINVIFVKLLNCVCDDVGNDEFLMLESWNFIGFCDVNVL